VGGAVEGHGRSRGEIGDESVGFLAGEDVADGGVDGSAVGTLAGEMAAGEESEDAEAGDGGLAGVGGGEAAVGFLAVGDAFEGAADGGLDFGPFGGSEDVHGVPVAGVLLGEEGRERCGQREKEKKAKAAARASDPDDSSFHGVVRSPHLW